MKRIITYTVKEDVGDKILVEEKEELHEFENTESCKYFAFKKIHDKAEQVLKNLQK